MTRGWVQTVMHDARKNLRVPRWFRSAWPVFLTGLVFVSAVPSDATMAGAAARAPHALVAFGSFVTSFGASGYMFAFSAAIIVCALVTLGRRRRMWNGASPRLVAERAIVFLSTIAVSGLLAQIVKHLVGRARPRLLALDGAFTFHPFSLPGVFASFPSGHTTSVFAAAVALGAMRPKWRPWLLAFAMLIGASRVLVGAHFPSDVVAGAALGTMTSVILIRGFARRRTAFVQHGGRVVAKT